MLVDKVRCTFGVPVGVRWVGGDRREHAQIALLAPPRMNNPPKKGRVPINPRGLLMPGGG